MAKRATGRAWRLICVFTAALVGGIGVRLTHGITLGHAEVRVVSLNQWGLGTTETHTCTNPMPLSMTRMGFFAVVVDPSPWVIPVRPRVVP